VSGMKRMSVEDFQRLGYLQEVNRQFLHPLGLALEVTTGGGEPSRLSGIWDCRDEPDGLIFEESELGEAERTLANRIEEEGKVKATHRLASLGYIVQPIGQ